MKSSINLLGNVAGAAGLLITATAAVARILGQYHMAGFETMTLFHGGVGLMVAACLIKVHGLSVR